MKKCLLHVTASLQRTSAAEQMCLLVRGLPPDSFDVHVCALARGGPLAADLEAAGVPVHPIRRRWQLDPQAFRQLRRHVARLRPDVIHGWLPLANAYALAAAKACGVKRLVAGLGFTEPGCGWCRKAVDHYVWRHCSVVVVRGPNQRDLYVRRGLSREKIRVIPYGVVPTTSNGLTRGQLLGELGLPEESRLIGLVGRLRRQARIKDAIWAADLLKVIRDDVHLLVVGDGPHRDRLRRFRDQVVIRDKVHFLGDRDDASRLMPHLDVLWSTGVGNAKSHAVMEAMAAGVPVVAADGPDLRELISPQKTGYLVPAGDRAGIARCTNKLLDDAELAQQMGQAGRRRIEREFHAEQMIDQYAGLYRGLAE